MAIRRTFTIAAFLVLLTGSAAFSYSVSPAPSVDRIPSLREVVTAVQNSENNLKVPTGPVLPPIMSAGLYWTSVNPTAPNPGRSGCVINDAATNIPASIGTSCAFGDQTSSKIIALVGDSNANSWIPALDTWAYLNKVKLVAVTHAACAPWGRPWLPKDKPIWGDITERKCEVWRSSMVSKVKALSPDLILPVGIVATDKLSVFPTQPVLTQAFTKMVQNFGTKSVALLEPVPQFGSASSVLSCIAGHKSALTSCEVHRSEVTLNLMNKVVRSVSLAQGVKIIPTVNLFCGKSICPIFVSLKGQTYLVYEDGYHVSHQYSQIIGASLEIKSLIK